MSLRVGASFVLACVSACGVSCVRSVCDHVCVCVCASVGVCALAAVLAFRMRHDFTWLRVVYNAHALMRYAAMYPACVFGAVSPVCLRTRVSV
eukprot:2833971-Alexandrium_andersonii.AAC.1